jgi:hypothetical protein
MKNITTEGKTLLDDIWVNVDTFKSKLLRDPATGCVNWTGSKHRQGYGFINIVDTKMPAKKKQTTTHRVAYRIANPGDPITPKDMIVHTCGNMLCCNPEHLVKGDRSTINKYRAHWAALVDERKRDCDFEYTTEEYCWMRGDTICRSLPEMMERFGITRQRARDLRSLTRNGSPNQYKWLKHFDNDGKVKAEYAHLYE